MRFMGIDYGTKTIGVAISDPLGWTAQGIEIIKRTNIDKDIRSLVKLVEEYDVQEIVVGFPKNMNNTIGPMAEEAQKFSELIHKKIALPVHLWDERWTTMEAERMLVSADISRGKRKKVIDKVAAVLILQGFLDKKNREAT